jgi:hypothetical protein
MVDNGSVDNSLEIAKKLCPNIEILINKTDVGFAGSVNNGVRCALKNGAEYVAVYSNDIKVLQDWIGFALEVFENNPATGLVGFKEIPKDEENLFIDNGVSSNNVKSSAAVPGCLFVCSMAVFHKIGLMDEGYFMYGEDNDFFKRVTNTGFKILQTQLPVWHYGEGASINKRFMPAWLAYRNALRCAIKNQGICGIVNMFVALFYHGCIASRSCLKLSPSVKRLKRYGRMTNLILLIGSCVWNLIFLPRTLWCRVYMPGPQCKM